MNEVVDTRRMRACLEEKEVFTEHGSEGELARHLCAESATPMGMCVCVCLRVCVYVCLCASVQQCAN